MEKGELAFVLEKGELRTLGWSVEKVKVEDECWKCKKKAELKMCGRCGAVKYCGGECQKADWNVHKMFCVPK